MPIPGAIKRKETHAAGGKYICAHKLYKLDRPLSKKENSRAIRICVDCGARSEVLFSFKQWEDSGGKKRMCFRVVKTLREWDATK